MKRKSKKETNKNRTQTIYNHFRKEAMENEETQPDCAKVSI